MFHRLVTPTYIGGLPTGYDYLNAAPPLTGSAAPVDPIVAAGPNTGTYFVAFGEDGRAAAVNRAVSALAVNTDAIDNFLHDNVAILKSQDFAVGAAVLTGTTLEPLFVGVAGTPNTAAGLEPYFHVTDQTNNDLVDSVTNTQSVVTGVSAGLGTFHVGAVTLTISPAPTVPYRIWYGTRSSLSEMKKDNLVRSSIWGVQRKQAGFIQYTNDLLSTAPNKGVSLIGIRTAGFHPNAVTQAGDGGIGTALSPQTAQQAFEEIDDVLVRRRAFTAVITDGVSTFGGDFNDPAIDTALAAFPSGASFFVRAGVYVITNATGTVINAPLSFTGETVDLTLSTARTSSLTLTNNIVVHGPVDLTSNSATGACWAITPSSSLRGLVVDGAAEWNPGAVRYLGTGDGGHFSIENVQITGTGLGGGSTNAALDIRGEGRVSLRQCRITGVNGSPLRALYLANFVDAALSSGVIEDCSVVISAINANALELSGITTPLVIKNCLFKITATSGSGYAVSIDTCANIIFDNCTFESENGQVLKHLNSIVRYCNCQWVSGSTAGVATGQMVVVQGGGDVTNCTCFVGSSSLRGVSGTIQKAVVELGGLDGTAFSGSGLVVDGLAITFAGTGHNYTAVLLHGNTNLLAVNRYQKITIDAGATIPSSAGTLNGKYVSDPAWVEVGGGTRNTCIVEDLSLINVKSPTTTHDRRVAYLQLATVRNLVVDGAASVGAGSYGSAVLEIDRVSAANMRVELAYPIKCTNKHISVVQSSWRGGLFYGNTSTHPSGFSWVEMSFHAEISEVMLLWSSAVGASAVEGIVITDDYCSVRGCKLWIDGTWSTDMLVSLSAHKGCRVQGNTFYWERQAASRMLLVEGDVSVVTDNQFIQAGASAFTPTWTVSGTGSIDEDNTAQGFTPADTVPSSP